MKIFRNRGDIYISKSGYKSSKEERILRTILIFIVVFTAIFLFILSRHYSSVSDFFSSGEVTITEEVGVDENELPKIEGKTNYLVIECDEDNSIIHYIYLIEADCDSLAYKVSTLPPEMKIDGRSVADIYSEGGGSALQSQLIEYFGFTIDYYAQFGVSDFIEFVNKMGSFIYPVSSAIRYDGGTEGDTYNIRLREGENKIDGRKLSALVRYYSNDKVSCESSNLIILYALTGLFNEDNFSKCDLLFRQFISHCSTNITVRDFENGRDKLEVFCKKNKDITIYSVAVEFERGELTAESVQNIKGYFSK